LKLKYAKAVLDVIVKSNIKTNDSIEQSFENAYKHVNKLFERYQARLEKFKTFPLFGKACKRY